MKQLFKSRALTATLTAIASAAVLTGGLVSSIAHAAPIGFLETLHKHTTLINTVPSNGDQNPYAIVVAPVSSGTVKQGDVLVGKFFF